jgi:hypothetical protein
MVHRSPEEGNPHECSSLCRTKVVAVCVFLGSSDNEHYGNVYCCTVHAVSISVLFQLMHFTTL